MPPAASWFSFFFFGTTSPFPQLPHTTQLKKEISTFSFFQLSCLRQLGRRARGPKEQQHLRGYSDKLARRMIFFHAHLPSAAQNGAMVSSHSHTSSESLISHWRRCIVDMYYVSTAISTRRKARLGLLVPFPPALCTGMFLLFCAYKCCRQTTV